MKNWAGSFEFFPTTIFSPKNEDEVHDIIKLALKNRQLIRVRGSSHSWTKLIESEQIFVDLDNMQGILEIDDNQNAVTAKAGTKLAFFGEEAFSHRLTMENQGDINKQSIAGATSTGTHGTGVNLCSMPNQIIKLKFINGKNEVVIIDQNHPWFDAARLALGSFGILTELTFQLVPAYKLKVETFPENFNESLSSFSKRISKHRHLEMFYFPISDWAMTKTMDITDDPVDNISMLTSFNETFLENWLYTQLNRLASRTGGYKYYDRLIKTFVSPKTKVDWSHRAFPSNRNFKFMEMEYAIPLENFSSVVNEIRGSIKKYQFKTLFPIEIRFVKNDNLWLSPAYKRDCVYFAIHTYISEDFTPYFLCMEKIFKKYNGRPHWGKWHSLKANDFKKLYPKFDDFLEIRKSCDPGGIFLNNHLKDLFGING